MLGVIVNEKEIVENALNRKLLIDNQSKIVHLLIKYYSGLGKTDMLDIKEEIFKVMQKCDNDFARPKWNEYLQKQIFKYLKNKERFDSSDELIQIEKIHITNDELNTIEKLKDKKLKKIAFILLVYVKIGQQLYKNDSEWINYSLNNIFKEAKISGNSVEKMKLLHELSNKGLITNNLDNRKCSIKINYINNDDSIGLEINKFEGVIHYYLNYIGEHWKKCSECDKWFIVKNNNQKYCSNCSKLIRNEKMAEYNKQNYIKIKNS